MVMLSNCTMFLFYAVLFVGLSGVLDLWLTPGFMFVVLVALLFVGVLFVS